MEPDAGGHLDRVQPAAARPVHVRPPGTYEPSVVEAAAIASAPIPVAELLEVVGGWPGERRRLRGGVHRIPDVSARHLAGAGHNIDHHLAGRQYRADVLDWAVELAAR
jgi:hypothetical protein